jgi:four helix bundle protein
MALNAERPGDGLVIAGRQIRRMNKYRSLDAWQRAHDLALRTLQITDAAFTMRRRSVFDQLRRAAISVEANVVEGYALGTTALFRRHLRIAFGSAAEAECLVRLALEAGYLTAEESGELEALCAASLATIRGLMRKLPAAKA